MVDLARDAVRMPTMMLWPAIHASTVIRAPTALLDETARWWAGSRAHGPGTPLATMLVATWVLWAGCREDYELPPEPPPETQPQTMPDETRSHRSGCDAPNGGALLKLDDHLGYVEWDVHGGRLYFLDEECRPMDGVTDVTLYIQRPGGPEEVTLVECPPPRAGGSCLSAAAGLVGADGAKALTDHQTQGVLRFNLRGQGCRVLLAYKPPASLPVDPPADPLPPGS